MSSSKYNLKNGWGEKSEIWVKRAKISKYIGGVSLPFSCPLCLSVWGAQCCSGGLSGFSWQLPTTCKSSCCMPNFYYPITAAELKATVLPSLKKWSDSFLPASALRVVPLVSPCFFTCCCPPDWVKNLSVSKPSLRKQPRWSAASSLSF